MTIIILVKTNGHHHFSTLETTLALMELVLLNSHVLLPYARHLQSYLHMDCCKFALTSMHERTDTAYNHIVIRQQVIPDSRELKISYVRTVATEKTNKNIQVPEGIIKYTRMQVYISHRLVNCSQVLDSQTLIAFKSR